MKNSLEGSPTRNTHEPRITDAPVWRELGYLAYTMPDLRDLVDDPNRRESLPVLRAGDIYVDFKYQRIDEITLDALVRLAGEQNIEGQIADMFSGVHVNTTEDRAALHIALRARETDVVCDQGINVMPEVFAVRRKMEAFTEKIHSEAWGSEKPIKHIVSIGIGGSNLGPEMACAALEQYRKKDLHVHFVANVDPNDINRLLRPPNGEDALDPKETLFIVESKTFTTPETMQNAKIARKWLVEQLGEDAVAQHFVAVSTNKEAVEAFGIDSNNMFEMWDWVGGRYSVTSAIGLPVMLAIGVEHFNAFLEGARVIDEHYRTASVEQNIPLRMALLTIWNHNFLHIPVRGEIAYDERLELFPLHLQQLSMESLGKRVMQNGTDLGMDANPYILPGLGTNMQHSWGQEAQMGSQIAMNFLAVLRPQHDDDIDQHNSLLGNMLAQAAALARGVTEGELKNLTSSELVAHKVMPGNRPSSIIYAQSLTPSVLGQLLALHEHATHAQGAILGINPFDQYGVERGKQIAKELGKKTQPGVALTPEAFQQLIDD